MAFLMKESPYSMNNTPIYEVDLEDGVVGKANLNGSILVQKGLDPLKQAELWDFLKKAKKNNLDKT